MPSMFPLRAVLCITHASSVTAESLVYYIATRLHWHSKTLKKECASRTKTKNKWKNVSFASTLKYDIFTVFYWLETNLFWL